MTEWERFFWLVGVATSALTAFLIVRAAIQIAWESHCDKKWAKLRCDEIMREYAMKKRGADE